MEKMLLPSALRFEDNPRYFPHDDIKKYVDNELRKSDRVIYISDILKEYYQISDSDKRIEIEYISDEVEKARKKLKS